MSSLQITKNQGLIMNFCTVCHLLLGLFIAIGAVSLTAAQDTSQTASLRSHDVSEETLEKVARAYESIENIREHYREEYGDLADAELPKDVERKLIEEFMSAVDREGISWNTYREVLKAINKDGVLHDRFLGYVGEEVVITSSGEDERDITRGVANGNAREITEEDMITVPVASAEEMVGLLPGIESGLRIRGGSASEVEFQVDGRTMRDGRTQAPFMGISYTQIEEIHVETGGFNAEYGNARSGVITVKTKGGIDAPKLVRVSDEKLDQIARAYVRVERIRSAYDLSEAELASDEKSREQRRAEFKMGQAIVDEGVDIDTYIEVLEAIDSNAALRQKLLHRVDRFRSN